MSVVVLPRSLAALFPGAPRRLKAAGSTVEEVIDDLERAIPGMRDRVCDGSALRQHLNVFVAGRRAGLDTPVSAEEIVHIIPAVSGG